jgi:hypothetical protein
MCQPAPERFAVFFTPFYIIMIIMEASVYSKRLQIIPGVGPNIARDLIDLGYKSVAELKWADPESMYQSLCGLRGQHIDRCVLYVFRCAVYYANSDKYDPELLKWWNWKDSKRPPVY